MQLHRPIIYKRSLFLWNSKIQSSTRNGYFMESLNLYESMFKSGIHGDNFTFPHVAKSCAKIGSVGDGMKIHAQVILTGFDRDLFVQTALLDMYSKCSNLVASRQLFEEMPVKSLVSWNSMISAYSNDFQIDESFKLLKQMFALDLLPNSSTFVNVLSGCSGSHWAFQQGLLIHCCAIKLGMALDLLLLNSIMSLYIRFDLVKTARCLFNLMEEKSNVSWTSIISGYVKLGDVAEAFYLFHQMQQEQVKPDSIALLNLVPAAAQTRTLKICYSVHAFIIKSGCDYEDKLASSLVSMYSKCEDLISARKVFNLTHEKSIFLWTSMISGYAQSEDADEALALFQNLLSTTVKPNEVTIATVLSACADFGSLSVGENIEEYVKVNGFESDLQVQTSLIHMYSKCGCIEKAKEVFDRVPNKDLAVWSSMINGYAVHGRVAEALAYLRR